MHRLDPFSNTPRLPGTAAVVGHRGAPRLAPENSPAAFAAAAAAGAAWVELDVRLSADALLVVQRDAWLADGTPVFRHPVETLRAVPIWPLADVLDGLPEGLGVDLEIKNVVGEPDYDRTDAVVALVAHELSARLDERPWMTSSFNPSTVSALADALPDVPAGLLHSSGMPMETAAALAADLGARVLCPNVHAPDLDADRIAAAHADGFAVMVWTVDDPSVALALSAAGADALCTNDPGGILAVLHRRCRGQRTTVGRGEHHRGPGMP